MPDPNWTRTRAALGELKPSMAVRVLPKLLVKGPKLIAAAQEIMAKNRLDFGDDKFKILMIHHLEKELPEFHDIYEAILADLMFGRPQLNA